MSNLFGRLSLVSLLTLFSRVLGLVRDILFFGCFGASMIGEAFILAFTFPNLFRRMFGEGTLTSAFLPIFSESSKIHSREYAFSFLNQILTRMFIFLGLLSVVICTVSFWISNDGIPVPEKWNKGFFLNCISFSYILLICCSAILVASLNSFGRFFEGSFSPLLLNLSMISAMLVGKYSFSLNDMQLASLLCGAVLFAGVLQLALPWVQLRRLFNWQWSISLAGSKEMSQLKSLFWVGALGAAVGQANILISRLFAYTLEESGGMSYLFISSRLIELPLGIFAIAIATVFFPELSKARATGDNKRFWDNAFSGLRLTAAVTVPAAIGLAFLGESIITALFRWGEFGISDVTASHEILIVYCFGLPFYGLSTFLVKIFHSEKNMKIPVHAAIVSLVVNAILSLFLVVDYQAQGLAWANSISAFFQTAYLGFFMMILDVKSLFRTESLSLPVILASSAIMFIVIVFLQEQYGYPDNKFDCILNLLFLIPAGALSYMLGLIIFKFPETRGVLRRIIRT